MTTTKTYGAILDGTVTGYNLDDCLKRAKGQAGPLTAPRGRGPSNE